MLTDFFFTLRAARLPVSVKEYLTLLEALKEGVIGPSIDDFYFLARTCLVKDETHYDKFDRAFGEYFKGVTQIPGLEADIPDDTAVLVRVRSAETVEGLELQPWLGPFLPPSPSLGLPPGPVPAGRFLEISLRLSSTTPGVVPRVFSLTASGRCDGVS